MRIVLLFLTWALLEPAFGQERPTLAVVEFTNESSAAWWRGGVGVELAGMLSNELAAIDDFRIVERSRVDAVLAEQNLAASGRVAAGDGPRIGQMLGADYLVMGTVTAYEEDVKGSDAGISFQGFSIGGKSERAYLAVDLRVIDSTTGEIAHARTIEGESKGGGVRFGAYRGGFGGTLANEEKTPAGKAIRAALIEITDYLECVMIDQTSRCLSKYEGRDDRRRERTRDALDFD